MKKQMNYKPHKNGFPYKLLKYLREHGTSAGINVQREIGLNKWADRKGIAYYNRASINFDGIATQLHQKGLIRILDNDYYELSKMGKEFMETYKVR